MDVELPSIFLNFTQKDLTEVKIFQKVLAGYFFETPCALVYIDGVVYCVRCRGLTGVGALNLARGQVSGWAFDRGAGDRATLDRRR